MEWTKVANVDANSPTGGLSFTQTVQGFNETMDLAAEVFGQLTPEEMTMRLPENPMRLHTAQQVLDIMIDHTAHHRGAIAQYARLLGKEPSIPYFDMSELVHETQLEAMRRPDEAANMSS